MFSKLTFPLVFPRFIVLTALLSTGLLGQVTFSEIMNNPATNEAHDEYIELYNSGPDSINLTGWFLDDSLGTDQIIEVGQGMVLAPGQFAVILDGSYFENSSTYDALIPDSALILRIADKAFGKNGLSNSTDRRLSLWSRDSILVSRYRYHATYPAGFSNEKVTLGGDNTPENWGKSLIAGGTPGFRNSISPYEQDLTLENLTWRPSSIVLANQFLTFNVTIHNSGLNIFTPPVYILVFVDVNGDSVFNEPDIFMYGQDIQNNIDPDALLEISFKYAFRNSGKYSLISTLTADNDQNPLNNSHFSAIEVLDASADLKLSEIKFLTFSDEPEWIEIYNKGNSRVNLQGWGLADLRDTTWIDSAVFLYPKQWKVLAAGPGLSGYYPIDDSLIVQLKNFITLNNDGDTVYLLNPAAGWQDQVAYTRNWLEGEENNTPSLERIRYDLDARLQSNWGPSASANGATPGAQNSLTISGELPQQGKISVTPNPFSPDGDGFEDNALIEMALPVATARIRVEIFDLSGRHIRSLKENTFSGSRDKTIWDGRDDSGHVVRMGIYIIFLQIVDDQKGVIREIKSPVVVAGHL